MILSILLQSASPSGGIMAFLPILLIIALIIFGVIRFRKKIKEIKASNMRYGALRTIAELIKVFAYIAGIGTLFLFTGISKLFGEGEIGQVIVVAGWIFAGVVILINLAISQSIKVFLDIEYNTRKTSNNTQANQDQNL